MTQHSMTLPAIRPGDFSDPQVIEMITFHVTTARAMTDQGCAFALDLAGLQTPDIRFWTLWDGPALRAMGALKTLPPEHGGPGRGEIKSMHTHREARRQGAGAAILSHLIAQARAAGMTELLLETGSWDYFRPAWALYEAHGFTRCGPFAAYPDIPSSIFMRKPL
jgi:putative acetyltransferase